MENTSDSLMQRPLLLCLKSEKIVCYSVPDNSQIPVFFVHGTEDHFVPYEMSLENYEACAGKKQFLTVKGASHTKSYLVEPDRYIQAVAKFFQWELAEV